MESPDFLCMNLLLLSQFPSRTASPLINVIITIAMFLPGGVNDVAAQVH